MRHFYYLIIAVISTYFLSCAPPEVKLSEDFDHGSLGVIEETNKDYFRGSTEHWIKWDSIGDQYYWFYFKADQVKDRQLTFELINLLGIYRGNPHLVYTDYTQPVYSYDQERWHRIQNVKYDSASHTFIFSQQFEQEPVWIAYAHPYPYSRLEYLISRIKDREYANLQSLEKSTGGREIHMITITDPQIPDDAKKTILIMAMQHAGEDAGGYLAEGLIDFLLSDDQQAQKARENFIYQILPMMNPDGIFNGISRYNLAMEDLNNIWLDESRAQPEVTGVKNWVNQWYQSGKKIDLFIDVHNHTQFHKYNVFIFQDNSLDSLVSVMDNYWPIRIWHSEFKGSSCAWFYRKGIPCGTIELSQSQIDEGPYLTIEDYLKYGEGTVLGIADFFMENRMVLTGQ